MKRLIAVLFVLGLMFVAQVSLASEVNVALPTANVTLNGWRIDSSDAEYPLIVYKDITYVPTTEGMMSFLGLKSDSNFGYGSYSRESYQTKAFFIGNNGQSSDTPDYPAAGAPNNESSYTAEIADCTVYINQTANYKRKEAPQNTELDYPVLIFRDVLYFPLTWAYAEEFDWEYGYSAENGLVIDSRNAFRPVWNFWWSRLPNYWYTFYVYNDDCYVGYHYTTLGGQTDFIWCRRGEEEKKIDFAEELYGLHIDRLDEEFNSEKNSSMVVPPELEGSTILITPELASVPPRIEGSIFTIRCVASDGGEYTNYDLRIDLDTGEFSAEKVEYGSPSAY